MREARYRLADIILFRLELTVLLVVEGRPSPPVAGDPTLFRRTVITAGRARTGEPYGRVVLANPSGCTTVVQLSHSLRQRTAVSAVCRTVQRDTASTPLVLATRTRMGSRMVARHWPSFSVRAESGLLVYVLAGLVACLFQIGFWLCFLWFNCPSWCLICVFAGASDLFFLSCCS